MNEVTGAAKFPKELGTMFTQWQLSRNLVAFRAVLYFRQFLIFFAHTSFSPVLDF